MPELSIIVPVYKVEAYLPRCIESILAQTFRDFELILIDDGSPDRCGAICDEYAAQDERITVIHQENQGVSAARNAGLDIATGTYLGFVDSDDWIEPEMYETMISTAKEKQVDVVVCGIRYISANYDILRTDLISEGTFDRDEMLETLYGMPNLLGGGCWNKVFLRDKLKDVRFQPNVIIAEDWLYLFLAFSQCNTLIKVPHIFCNIFERPGSATRRNDLTVYMKIIESKEILLKLAEKYSFPLSCKAVDKYLDDCLRYSLLMKESGNKSGQSVFIYRMKIKFTMLKSIFKAYRKHMLPKAKLHGYILGMIKI